jgi:IS30 family transposase
MACQLETTAATGAKVYFCDSGSRWQRGTNENTNRLLRRYFPNGTDLSRHSIDDRTPAQAFTELLTSHTTRCAS